MSLPTKHITDWAAATTGLLSWWKLVPWSDVAGFLSVVWIGIQVTVFLINLIRDSLHDDDDEHP